MNKKQCHHINLGFISLNRVWLEFTPMFNTKGHFFRSIITYVGKWIESLAMVALKNRRAPFFSTITYDQTVFPPIKQHKQQLHRLCKLSQRKREFGYRYMSPCVQQNLQIVYDILCECKIFFLDSI